MHSALADLDLRHLWVIYPGTTRYPAHEKITCCRWPTSQACRLKSQPAGKIPAKAAFGLESVSFIHSSMKRPYNDSRPVMEIMDVDIVPIKNNNSKGQRLPRHAVR